MGRSKSDKRPLCIRTRYFKLKNLRGKGVSQSNVNLPTPPLPTFQRLQLLRSEQICRKILELTCKTTTTKLKKEVSWFNSLFKIPKIDFWGEENKFWNWDYLSKLHHEIKNWIMKNVFNWSFFKQGSKWFNTMKIYCRELDKQTKGLQNWQGQLNCIFTNKFSIIFFAKTSKLLCSSQRWGGGCWSQKSALIILVSSSKEQ